MVATPESFVLAARQDLSERLRETVMVNDVVVKTLEGGLCGQAARCLSKRRKKIWASRDLIGLADLKPFEMT
jgi:hypothetical protein